MTSSPTPSYQQWIKDALHQFRAFQNGFGKSEFDLGKWDDEVDALLKAVPSETTETPGYRLVREDVCEFLRGAAPLEGIWYGDPKEDRQGKPPFWWRQYLGEHLVYDKATRSIRAAQAPAVTVLTGHIVHAFRNAAPQAGRVCEPRFPQESRVAGPAVAAPVIPSDKTVPIEKARERIAGIEEYLARQKTTSVKEEQAHLVEGSDASLYWHFGYMMALKDIFRLSGKQQDQDGKIFQ